MKDIANNLKENMMFNSKDEWLAYTRNNNAKSWRQRIKNKMKNDDGITGKELIDFITDNKLENFKITVYNSDGEDDTATFLSHDGETLTIM